MRYRNPSFFIFLIGLIALGTTLGIAQQESEMAIKQAQGTEKVTIDGPLFRKLENPIVTGATHRSSTKAVPVAIIYDDGIVTALPAISSYCFGNRFNTASGSAVVSHSVTQLSFFIYTGAGTDNVFVSVFGPVAGTSAPVLGSASVPLNNGPGAFNTATVGTYAGAGSFLAGVWYIAGDTVGLGSGTVNAQGHHGMAINDIAGTDFQTLPGLNALVGASTAFVPVELMQFDIE